MSSNKRFAAAASALAVAVAVGCSSTRDTSSPAPPAETTIEWPANADEPLRLTTTESTSIAFSIEGAAHVGAKQTTANDERIFPRAVDGEFDLIERTIQDGVEDFVRYPTRPKRSEVTYDLALHRNVAGLRRAPDSSIEMLDATGTPRLRMSAPFLIDRDQKRIPVTTVAIEGCAFDDNPAPPWRRPVTPPGNDHCKVRIAWSNDDVAYPAVLDPSWAGTKALVGAPYGHAMAVLPSNLVLVASGYFDGQCSMCGIGATPATQLFDPDTRTWSSAGNISTTRVHGAFARLPSGGILFVGGNGRSQPERYLNNGWLRFMASLSTAEHLTATSLVSGKVLIAGGRTGAPTASAELFDEATPDDSAPAGAAGAMTVARTEHTATRLPSGKVLLAGGANDTNTSRSTAEIYDPQANTFTAVPSGMKAAHVGHIAADLGGGKVLIAGGDTTAAEIYDEATNAFTALTATTKQRHGGEAVTLDSGRIMIIGGIVAGTISTDVEIYDPVAQTFTPQTAMSFARADFTAARIKDGNVLAAGGRNPGGYSVGTAEVWTPNAAGTKCAVPDDCRSGDCEEGICCAAACEGACKTCVATTGACVAVITSDDPNSCTGLLTCDAQGACKKKNGQACAAQTECASGFCVDGSCCDRACGAQCEACDVAGHEGTCLPVVGDSHGARVRCPAFGSTCGGACNGAAAAACAFPSAITTCENQCADAKLAVSTCDGKGACIADRAQPCPGNFVCADTTQCKTSCAGDQDCASGYRCDATKCIPIPLCSGSVVRKGQEVIDCSPYTCEQTGICRTSCASVADCAEPNKVCSRDGRCIDPPPPFIDEGGCTIGRPSKSTLPLSLAVLLLLVAARRRRHAQR